MYGNRHARPRQSSSPRAFFSVHRDLPREAPGSATVTLRALSMTTTPTHAQVLDIGCGTGRHTLELARALPDAHLTGLDAHQPYLEVLKSGITAANLAERVEAVLGDMRAPPFADNTFDLLWCEAAVYVMGFEPALIRWCSTSEGRRLPRTQRPRLAQG